MSLGVVYGCLHAGKAYGVLGSPLPPAVADGPVADTAETVTPQAGIMGLDADRDDGHTMGHK